MHLNNYHNPQEKTEKISTDKTDPEDILQKLKDIFNYLQNLKSPFKK